MHEKDIELTRLLLKEHQERQVKAAALLEEHSSAKHELDSIMEVKKQREDIHDVLSRAASLLDRADLGVELPDSAELEQQVSQLDSQLGKLQAEVETYQGLLDELKQKAPDLLKVAQAENNVQAGADAAPEEQPKPNPNPAPPIVGQDGGGPESAVAQIEPSAGPEPAHAVLSKLNKRERRKLLSVFKLKALSEKEAFAHGRGAVYLVDTKSIFEQVSDYGYSDPDANQPELHSKLALQFYGLSLELSGSFHLVFNAAFPDHNNYGDLVTIDAVEGDQAVYATKLQELVGLYSGKLRTVCLVTGDQALAKSVDGQGAHLIPLGDFFN